LRQEALGDTIEALDWKQARQDVRKHALRTEPGTH
jgi:hypothetical protein